MKKGRSAAKKKADADTDEQPLLSQQGDPSSPSGFVPDEVSDIAGPSLIRDKDPGPDRPSQTEKEKQVAALVLQGVSSDQDLLLQLVKMADPSDSSQSEGKTEQKAEGKTEETSEGKHAPASQPSTPAPMEPLRPIIFTRAVAFSVDDRFMALLDQDSRLSVVKVSTCASDRLELLSDLSVVEMCFEDDEKGTTLLVLATDRKDDNPVFFPPPLFWQNQPPESFSSATPAKSDGKADNAATGGATSATSTPATGNPAAGGGGTAAAAGGKADEKKEEVKNVTKCFSLYRIDISSWDAKQIAASKSVVFKQNITGKGCLRVGACFSSDASLIAVWDLHNLELRVWFTSVQAEDPLKTGDKQLFKHLKDPHQGNNIFDCSWGKNASLLATCGNDGVRIFDVAQTANASLEAPTYMQCSTDRVVRVEFAPDGHSLITESLSRWKPTTHTWDTQVSLWNVVDNFTKLYSFPMEAEPFFSLDGNMLASVLPSTVKIAVWRIEGVGRDATVVPMRPLEGHTDLPWKLRWGEGGRLAAVGRDGYIRVWRLDANNPDAEPKCRAVLVPHKTVKIPSTNKGDLKCFVERGPQQLAWTHSGSHLFVSCLPELPGKDRIEHSIGWMWHLPPDHLVRSLHTGQQAVCFAMSTPPSSSHAKRHSMSGVASVGSKDAAPPSQKQWLALGGLQSLSLVSLIPEDQKSLAEPVTPPQSHYSVPAPNGSKISDLVKALAFTPDGKFLAAAWGSMLVVYDVSKEVWSHSEDLPKNKPVEAISFSAGSEYLAVGDNTQVTLYEFDRFRGTLTGQLALVPARASFGFKTTWRELKLHWPSLPHVEEKKRTWFHTKKAEPRASVTDAGAGLLRLASDDTGDDKKWRAHHTRFLLVVGAVEKRESAWLFDLSKKSDMPALARPAEAKKAQKKEGKKVGFDVPEEAEKEVISLPEIHEPPLFSSEDVNQVVWANGGDLVFATAEKPAVVRLWHPVSKKGVSTRIELLSVYKGHTGAQVQTVAFSSDNLKLVSSSGVSLRVWHRNGHNLSFLSGHKRQIKHACFGLDDTQIISTDKCETRVWSLYNQTCLAVLPYFWPILGAAFSEHGRHVYTWLVSGEVLVWQSEGLSLPSYVAHCFNPVGFGSQQARSAFCRSLQCHQPLTLPASSRFPAKSTLLHVAVLRDDVLAVEAFTHPDSAAFSPGALGVFFPENEHGMTAIDLALQLQQRHLLAPMLVHITDPRVPPDQRWALTKAIGNGLAKSYPDLLLVTMRRLPMQSAAGLGVHNPANRYANLDTQYKGSWDLAEASLWDKQEEGGTDDLFDDDDEDDDDRDLVRCWSRMLSCCLADTNRRRRKQAAADRKSNKFQSKQDGDLDPNYDDMTGTRRQTSTASSHLRSIMSQQSLTEPAKERVKSKEEEEEREIGDDDDMQKEEGGRPADAQFVPLPALTALYYRAKGKDKGWASKIRANKFPGQSPLKAVVSNELKDVVATDAFKACIEFKWRMYARPILTRQIFRFCVFLIAFSLAVSQTDYSICPEWTKAAIRSNSVQVLWDLLLALLALINLRFLYIEVRQFYREGAEYFYSIWNWFDMVAYSGVMTVMVLRYVCSPYTDDLAAVVVILMWFKLLEYGRAFMATGKFVLMLLRMVQGIGSFMFVMLVIYIGFSVGFAILLGKQGSDTGEPNTFTGYRVLVASWDVLGGGNPLLSSFSWDELSILSWVLFFIYSFVSAIVLLNLLVAVMSSIYEEIEANVEGPWLLERAKIVLQVERENGFAIKRNKKRERKNFPRWIHRLVTVEDVQDSMGGGGDGAKDAQDS